MILSSEFLVLRPKTTSYHYFPSKSRWNLGLHRPLAKVCRFEAPGKK
jgi:hypothetical protein